jgi:hypothetical protein
MNIVAGYPVSAFAPSVVGGTGTSAKYFPYVPGASIGAVRTTPSANSGVGMLKVLGNGRLDGVRMHVDAVGSIVVDSSIACPAVTIELVANDNPQTDGHNPHWVVIGTSGSLTTHDALGAGEPFAISEDLYMDSRTKELQGLYTFLFSNNLESSTPAVISNQINNIDPNADVPFGLALRVTFSVSGAANAAYLTQFNLQA